MKLPLKIGLPLLGLLLVGLAFSEGPGRLVLLLAAMGVALWSAFSLPRPAPGPEPRPLGAPPPDAEDADEADEADEAPPPRAPGQNGRGRGG
jgi:hypothetical protein